MDKIEIKNLEIFANHGVFPEENVLGQKFVISATLYTDTRKAGLTDELTASIHYGEVSHMITKFTKEHTYKLLEALAENLCQMLLQELPLLKMITLRVEKPWAPVALPLETVAVEITRGWHTAYVAFGSNLGDKKKFLDDGIQRLRTTPSCEVEAVSEYLVTEPYGGVEQDEFLNGVLKLRTLLTPEELLDRLHELEAAANRERIIHWGPRTLDLDILFYDNEIIDTPDLHIPHIDMENRDFVLKPMDEIAPYYRHPVLNKTIHQLLNELELAHLAKQKAMTLSGGERRRLEITRALVTNPAFILLDEPFSGVDPIAVYDVQQIIYQLKQRNMGILITDHNVRETLSCVDRAYLMAQGTIVCEGDSNFLVNDPKAREVYLGPQFTM